MKLSRLNLAVPFLRRSPRPATLRSYGAELFREHADKMQADTQRILDLIAQGDLVERGQPGGPDITNMVRGHRDSLARKVEDDLRLAEFVERLQRFALVRELHDQYPELFALAVRSQEPVRGRQTNELEATVAQASAEVTK